MNRRLYKKIFRVPQKSFYIFAFFALAVFIFVFIPRPALATIDGLTEDSSKIIISGGASTITISGTLYLDEGLTPLGSKTIKVAIGTSTPGVFSTTADG
ncbi:hypothetical protein KJ853_04740, partial [Patescibacteria group bacterium]|nr:hypothetical protein [Patescibacteria group bacterium]